MIEVKGIYSWQLVDKDTGQVIQEGEQENMITDDWLYTTLSNCYSYKYYYYKLFLSSTDPTTVDWGWVNPKWIGSANGRISITSEVAFGHRATEANSGEGTVTFKTNFGPRPSGTTTTYYYIGLRRSPYDSSSCQRINSLTQLTNPITQDDTQYLYVTYKMVFNFDGRFAKANNDLINNYFSSKYWLIRGWVVNLLPFPHSYNYGLRPYTTVLLPAVDNDLVGNLMSLKTNLYNKRSTHNNAGDYDKYAPIYTTYWDVNWGVNDEQRPLGTVVYVPYSGDWKYWGDDNFKDENGNSMSAYTNRSSAIVSYSGFTPTPTISRIFSHNAAKWGSLFNEASTPPLSRGVMTATGNPNNKPPLINHIKFTKTGGVLDNNIISDPNQVAEYVVNQRVWYSDDTTRFYNNIHSVYRDKDKTIPNYPQDYMLNYSYYSQLGLITTFNKPTDNEFIYSLQNYSSSDNSTSYGTLICKRRIQTVESSDVIDRVGDEGDLLSAYMSFKEGLAYENLLLMAMWSPTLDAPKLFSFDMSTDTLTELTIPTGFNGSDISDITYFEKSGSKYLLIGSARDNTGFSIWNIDDLNNITVDTDVRIDNAGWNWGNWTNSPTTDEEKTDMLRVRHGKLDITPDGTLVYKKASPYAKISKDTNGDYHYNKTNTCEQSVWIFNIDTMSIEYYWEFGYRSNNNQRIYGMTWNPSMQRFVIVYTYYADSYSRYNTEDVYRIRQMEKLSAPTSDGFIWGLSSDPELVVLANNINHTSYSHYAYYYFINDIFYDDNEDSVIINSHNTSRIGDYDYRVNISLIIVNNDWSFNIGSYHWITSPVGGVSSIRGGFKYRTANSNTEEFAEGYNLECGNYKTTDYICVDPDDGYYIGTKRVGHYAQSLTNSYIDDLDNYFITYDSTTGKWIPYVDETTTPPIKVSDTPLKLPYGVSISFDNAPGVAWDEQFVIDEDYTFVTAQMPIKDNLQTYNMKLAYIATPTDRRQFTITIPADNGDTVIIDSDGMLRFNIVHQLEIASPGTQKDFRDWNVSEWFVTNDPDNAVVVSGDITQFDWVENLPNPIDDSVKNKVWFYDRYGAIKVHPDHVGDTITIDAQITVF